MAAGGVFIEREKMESEFGRGLTYCIGLFLAHAKSLSELRKKNRIFKYWAETWFNGASDHLYELDVSQINAIRLRKEIENWSEKVLKWGHGFPKEKATEKDVVWAIGKAKEFLRRIDTKLLKTKTIKGQYE